MNNPMILSNYFQFRKYIQIKAVTIAERNNNGPKFIPEPTSSIQPTDKNANEFLEWNPLIYKVH